MYNFCVCNAYKSGLIHSMFLLQKMWSSVLGKMLVILEKIYFWCFLLYLSCQSYKEKTSRKININITSAVSLFVVCNYYDFTESKHIEHFKQ